MPDVNAANTFFSPHRHFSANNRARSTVQSAFRFGCRHTLALKEARLAVAADSLLAEGRDLSGFELAGANWDLAAGLAEMNCGLALNPSSPDALFMVASFSYLSGNAARALALATTFKE